MKENLIRCADIVKKFRERLEIPVEEISDKYKRMLNKQYNLGLTIDSQSQPTDKQPWEV